MDFFGRTKHNIVCFRFLWEWEFLITRSLFIIRQDNRGYMELSAATPPLFNHKLAEKKGEKIQTILVKQLARLVLIAFQQGACHQSGHTSANRLLFGPIFCSMLILSPKPALRRHHFLNVDPKWFICFFIPFVPLSMFSIEQAHKRLPAMPHHASANQIAAFFKF